MSKPSRAIDAVAVILYALAVSAVVVVALKRPAMGWDVLGYTAAMLAIEESEPARIHARSYAYLRAAVPPDQFERLATGGDDANVVTYRDQVYSGPTRFTQQIPFYGIRWLYIGPAYLLYKAGLDPPRALLVISIASYVAIAALLLLWISAHMPRTLAALLALLIALNPLLLFVGRTTTPDALSAAIILWSLYFALEHGKVRLCALLLIVSVFARTDNVILAILLLAGLWGLGHRRLAFSGRAFALSAMALVGVYLGINAISGNYGWETLFHHQFIALMANPAEQTVALAPRDYVAALKQGFTSVLYSTAPTFILLGAVAYLLPAARGDGNMNRVYDALLVLIAVNMAARFALFPAFIDRLFVVQYLMIVMLLVMKAARAFRAAVPNFRGSVVAANPAIHARPPVQTDYQSQRASSGGLSAKITQAPTGNS